jgi:hypothetical protein
MNIKAVHKNMGDKESYILGNSVGGRRITKLEYNQDNLSRAVWVYVGDKLDRIIFDPDIIVILNEENSDG